MTNLKAYQEQIHGDIQRFKTAANFATGTDEEIAQTIAEQFAILDNKVALTRGHYVEYRDQTIANATKNKALNGISIGLGNVHQADRTANKFNVELIGASDAAAQNVVLNELESVLKYFNDGDKAAFYQHIPKINDLLVDKAASKEALQSVIAEVKNYVNPHEVALEEAQALPTVIGEDFETIKANYEASLETGV